MYILDVYDILNVVVTKIDRWRYHYPEFDTSQHWVKVPSQALSDMLMEAIEASAKEESDE